LPPARPIPFRAIARVAIVVFLVLILISELLVYTPALSGRPAVTVELGVDGNQVVGNATIHVSVASDFRQAIYLIRQFPAVSTVYFYYDSSYPISYSNPVDWYGLSQHIGTVSGFRGNPIGIVLLNAQQLSNFLNDSATAPGSVLVMASGVLPDTIFTASFNYLSPWIRNGGTLVWIGDKIGTYSGGSGGILRYPSPANPGANGTGQFVNVTLFGGIEDLYTNPSSLASAFNLNYTYAIPYDDLNMSRLPGHRGTPLGNVNGDFTNIATIPLGAGQVVYFGGPTEDATNLGTIVTNLLESGALNGDVVLVNVTSVSLAAGQTVTIPIDSALPHYPYGPGPIEVCSFLTQTDYLALFATTDCAGVA
jgi:hypothetical protein